MQGNTKKYVLIGGIALFVCCLCTLCILAVYYFWPTIFPNNQVPSVAQAKQLQTDFNDWYGKVNSGFDALGGGEQNALLDKGNNLYSELKRQITVVSQSSITGEQKDELGEIYEDIYTDTDINSYICDMGIDTVLEGITDEYEQAVADKLRQLFVNACEGFNLLEKI